MRLYRTLAFAFGLVLLGTTATMLSLSMEWESGPQRLRSGPPSPPPPLGVRAEAEPALNIQERRPEPAPEPVERRPEPVERRPEPVERRPEPVERRPEPEPEQRGPAPPPRRQAQCENTVQGRSYIADSTGLACLRGEVDALSGCCPLHSSARELRGQYTCSSCAEDHCCGVYELCVTCCSDPSQAEVRQQMREQEGPLAQEELSQFEYCRHRCRTDSKVLEHENAYAQEAHFCYTEPPPLSPDNVVVGEQSESCDEACKRNGKRCDAESLRQINTCAALQGAFDCVACDTNQGYDQPAQVVAGPKKGRGKCLVNGDEAYISCSGSHAMTRRLCACKAQ